MDPLEFTGFDISRLYRRDCVQCDDSTPLTCPTCPTGQVCIQVSPTCDQCASRKCVPNAVSGANTNSQSSQSSGPNIGAIVGGVLAGIVFIAIVTFCVWWFVIRKRRQQWEAEYVQDYDKFSEKGSQRGTYDAPPPRARSEATRSIASTTYTRGSNVIQIAFIPGVTDRNDGFTPPVPPIPSSQPHSPYTDASGDHYFMPGDLRDSTYSGFTDDGASTIDRRSVARSLAPSIAPSLLRESIASHAYQEDAIANPMPAQTALRGRANMVSVKSGTTSRSPSVPAVPAMDRTRFPIAVASGISSNSGVPTTTTASTNRPQPQLSPDSPTIPTIHVSDSSSDRTDAMSIRSGPPHLKSAIEEATRRASAQPTHGGLGSVKPAAVSTPTNRDPSPFSDANRVADTSSAESSPRSFHTT